MDKIIIYHGSSEIVKQPVYEKESRIMIMESDSIAQNIWNLPRNGPALKILMDLLMNMSWI